MNHTDLIIDVGMHNGDDTAYYLSRGFRVVAIDANPKLCESGMQRFSHEIQSGRLVIKNVGVANQTGDLTFWINSDIDEVSSFDQTMASRFGGQVDPVIVQTVRFHEILQEYGTPHYLKIDIEGLDSLCLRDLDGNHLPKYLSVEAHSLEPLFLLYEAGYREFKCINQMYHSTPQAGIRNTSHTRRGLSELWTGIGVDFTGSNLGHKLDHARKRVWRGLKRRVWGESPQPLAVRAPRPSQDNGQVSVGTSGYFGEETAGEWRDLNSIAYDWLHLKQGFPWRSSVATPGWLDFHARRD